MNNTNKDVPKYIGFIKFGSLENMTKFYEKGELYLNTFSYFKSLEYRQDGRADKNEYVSQHFAGDGVKKLTVQFIPHDNTLDSFMAIGEKDFNAITLDYGNDKVFTHIYCISALNLTEAIKNDLVIDKRNFAPDKDYAVFIYNGNEFRKRLENVLNHENIPFEARLVDYVNKHKYSGEMGAFRKFDEYSYQNEFRIACQFSDLQPKILNLGSLEDIASKPLTKKQFYETEISYSIKDETGHIIHKQITNSRILENF